MNSSMLTGERRWASGRRGGMTVLGKVAVPKPLNLPSQRLENHGVDPNVEIVPKGTLSWGTRSSSSGSNAWISSSLSPKADADTISTSHLSGCPSPGGTSTRPSTGGSDGAHEPVTNAWVSNSRPSSASGTFPSNRTSSSTSLRPRSAETRPNSSQLSRFAEPVHESPVAWGPSITAEKLGIKSKEDGFSLSSGEFPTLGSAKDSSVKNSESEAGHCRPISASGRIAQEKEDLKSQADIKRGTASVRRIDGSQSAEDGITGIEKWEGDPQRYFSTNVIPQHFNTWRGPPINAPAGVWYRGRPPGPAFGAPGGFPMEPFPYYRPQMPPPPLAPHLGGPQQAPLQAADPRGPHSKNADIYRPHMPDAYAPPGMPLRPGFYQCPMAFEGYYGPPMGYCYSERDIPYMGMAQGPPLYNGYPAPSAPDLGHSRSRDVGHGPAGKMLSEQVEADRMEDTRGSKGVLLKNHSDSDREEGENGERDMISNVSHPCKSSHPFTSSRKNEWAAEDDTNIAVFGQTTAPIESLSSSSGYKVRATESMRGKSFENAGNVKPVSDNWTNKSRNMLSVPPEMPRLPRGSERDSALPTATKGTALMQKIDGLNAKVRVSVGPHDAPRSCNTEEQKIGCQIVDHTDEVSNTAGSFERTRVSRDVLHVPHEVSGPVGGDKPAQSLAATSRSSYQSRLGRVDHHSKGKFSSEDADGWQKKPLAADSSSAFTVSHTKSEPDKRIYGPNCAEVAENSTINLAGKVIVESVETYDSTDIQAQRAKMRELTKQRALQLKKEEEERTREQKAKALAKLEELNRRTLAGEVAGQKVQNAMAINDIQGEKEETRPLVESLVVDRKFQEPNLNLVSHPDVTAVDTESNTNPAGKSVEMPINLPLEMQTLSHGHPPAPHEGAHDDNSKRVAYQLTDGGVSRHKRTGNKQKHNSSWQKRLNEKQVSSVASEAQKGSTHVATIGIISSENHLSEIIPSGLDVPNTANTVFEPAIHQKRKSNRMVKNKLKQEADTIILALPAAASYMTPGKESIENVDPDAASSNLGVSFPTANVPDTLQSQEECSSVQNEVSRGRLTNQWKPEPSRRMPRSQQADRFLDKLHSSETVIWAPVRNQNRAEDTVEASMKYTQESANLVNGDSISKCKRAEMERYVPKPVAKELAQQGGIPPSSSSISSSRSDEIPGRELSGTVSSANSEPVSSGNSTACIESIEVINEGAARHNRHKNEHGTWRKRVSADSSHSKGVHLGFSQRFEQTDIQLSKEQSQSMKYEIDMANAEARSSGVISPTDGYSMNSNTTIAAVSKYPVVKGGTSGRGKRHPSRGPRNMGNNQDAENCFSGEVDGSCMQSAAPDVTQTERNIVSIENRSHRQLKSQSSLANDHNGNRSAGSESMTTNTNMLPKKDHYQHKLRVPRSHDKDSSSAHQPQPGPSVECNVAKESTVSHDQEFSGEKRPAPAKRRPYSPNQDACGIGKTAPAANTDHLVEHKVSSGSRRNGSQIARPIKGHESHGDRSSGHDNRSHNIYAFRGRQKQTVHYEYQPVGTHKGTKPEKVDEQADGADGKGQRYRERSQSYSKHGGNFNRQQSGAGRIDSN